jgi:hypothetical protein
MANFSVSNILTAQTMVSDKYKAAEMRMKPAPAFSLLTGNDNFLIQRQQASRRVMTAQLRRIYSRVQKGTQAQLVPITTQALSMIHKKLL